MNQYEAFLAAQAHVSGRAVRRTTLAHRRLLQNPMVIVPWQLGGEPFSASAIAFGTRPDRWVLTAAGDSRNRDLAFAALLRFAAWFIPRFEAPSEVRDSEERYGRFVEISRDVPQIVVPNRAGVALLGRLGRRLAYLPTAGDNPAPLELVRLGQHFQFVARHADEPGQQVIVPMANVMSDGWATPQTEFERTSLAALTAWVAPPAGTSGYDAALEAETTSVGPAPAGDEDAVLERLVEAFNLARAKSTEADVVGPLLGPIEMHYQALTRPVWEMVWSCLQRERLLPEAPSVIRRWNADRELYTRHMDWVAQSGRRRTRQTARQAITTMRRLEDAKARLEAEEALDDPVRMIPYLLDGKAIEGRVVAEDPHYKEIAKVREVARPLVTIQAVTDRPLPRGKKLHWTGDPSGPEWEVQAIQPISSGGFLVTMKQTIGGKHPRPRIGEDACFSIHGFGRSFNRRMGDTPPWPLVPSATRPEPAPIESPA